MQSQITLDQLQEARGLPVYDAIGEKIGTVEEIFYDEPTNEPLWIGIGAGFFGTKRVLVPVEGATMTPDGYSVPYARDTVRGAPDIDSDEISHATEADLYSYYGLRYSEAPSDTRLPERGATTGDSLTRSEEELRVGKREVGVGTARLRKWVETEPVETDVELKRETARVTREPLDETVSGAEIGAEQVEVGLTAEEPVVEKRTVAKERIGLEKDVQTERETVSGTVRKERVKVEGEDVVDERLGR